MNDPVTATSAELHSDPLGARIGMWLFLFTEIILFGGLFLMYFVYRWRNQADFHYASGTLDLALGTANTMILLTSSLFMALAVAFAVQQRKRLSTLYLSLTSVCGLVFLTIKGVEWSHKLRHGLYPDAAELQLHTGGENLFYSLYFAMTGLHALHVIIGLGIIAVLLARLAGRGTTASDGLLSLVENGGLYWHFVDIVWIFLFPLFYLIS
jgi:cytochrome c oxidase subunit III